MAYISEHISWTEAIRSKTAKKHEIENIPNQSQIVNMKSIAKNVFEPLRTWASEPIRINSFFRSPELCTKIKSKPTSQHTKGQALDIDAIDNINNRNRILKAIKNNNKISYEYYV